MLLSSLFGFYQYPLFQKNSSSFELGSDSLVDCSSFDISTVSSYRGAVMLLWDVKSEHQASSVSVEKQHPMNLFFS